PRPQALPAIHGDEGVRLRRIRIEPNVPVAHGGRPRLAALDRRGAVTRAASGRFSRPETLHYDLSRSAPFRTDALMEWSRQEACRAACARRPRVCPLTRSHHLTGTG